MAKKVKPQDQDRERLTFLRHRARLCRAATPAWAGSTHAPGQNPTPPRKLTRVEARDPWATAISSRNAVTVIQAPTPAPS